MSSSLQTLCRGVRATPVRALRLSVSQARRLSTTEPSRHVSSSRDFAVHDPIMDKFWGTGISAAQGSTVVKETPVVTTCQSRDPPLGTDVFEPSAAPRWSGMTIPSSRQ
ncbi:hypothetical protein F66182_8655 [Fusarium sp. NRRL 66182]|nr:hypothetical protein F66182_8655 [Fusarium sp. NRRL 66182]